MSNDRNLEVKRDVPGEYGAPILGSVLDQLDRFYGKNFFEKRRDEYGSTVFRVNMPPGPPFFPDSKVIALLDQKSFPVLFDLTKVSKKNVFTGTYVPSTGFTGGYRVLSYLGQEEPKHAQLKSYCMDILSSNHDRWIPELRAAAAAGYDEWDAELNKPKKSGGLLGGIVSGLLPDDPPELNPVLGKIALRFLTKTVLDKDATEGNALTETGIKLWIAPQIAPVLNAGLPAVIQEPLLHTAPIPFIIVAPEYHKIVRFFKANGERAVSLAVPHGIDPDEALHNLVFFICFNTFGGLTILWPALFKHVSDFDEFDLQAELREEVRRAVGRGGVDAAALGAMPLLQSTVYEVLRIEPPVQSQYGKAKVDFVLETHVEAFKIKAGEMLYGYQPLVTRDPVVFEEPEKFKPRRFMGEEGQRLLEHVFWSNGPETSSPSVDNKQCPGKNFVVLVTRILFADFFLHYDSFKLGDAFISGTSSVYPFTELKKRA
ncbi:hypothetical protein SELMODRAFT_228572 [Selaginella moellendorffii]|uniref:etheroleic acid synthase n=1 Tax=Selaginella moellendorffii TaxID=88036 RepID=D8S630_SELML|nr:allene oxide synthase [Selaginella moellendorffii]EFJ20274.1 hypothetical protein SELMODRAFT_228572 [Selaginella moellendorffii]|eukprot:XP_002978827.1 allene oxide synthase [Selaginella moellendorffii]